MAHPAPLPSVGLVMGPTAPVAGAVEYPAFLPALGLLGGASPAAAVAPVITTTTLADVAAGATGTVLLAATGTTPLVFAVVSGTLPGWITLASNGALSWTSAAPSYTAFTVECTNSAGSDQQVYTLTVPNEISGGGEVESWPVLSPGAGAFTLTGADVGFQYLEAPATYTLDPGAGTFTVAGADVTFVVGPSPSPGWRVLVVVQSANWRNITT